jgi:hypothetical protein
MLIGKLSPLVLGPSVKMLPVCAASPLLLPLLLLLLLFYAHLLKLNVVVYSHQGLSLLKKSFFGSLFHRWK